MKTTLLCALVALLQVQSPVANSPSSCPVFPGLPGRDGMPGPQGPPGICACSELSKIVDSNTALKNTLEESLQNLTNSLVEALGRIQQEIATTNSGQPCSLGLSSSHPTTSSREILQCNPSAQSGYYWLNSNTTESREVYCAMDTTYCNITGGWMRLAYFNMTEPGASCPTSLRQIDTPAKLCGRLTAPGCSGITFPTDGIRYSKVCGQARGYQYNSISAFGESSNNIDTTYVEGVSITYGFPRQHLWTYAVGLSDDDNHDGGRHNCPCATPPGGNPPAFVGQDYYCESGFTGAYRASLALDDPLWDGDGCGPGNNCCNQTGLPWFYRTLSQEVGDDIEVRLCANSGTGDEEVYVELVEIFVQ